MRGGARRPAGGRPVGRPPRSAANPSVAARHPGQRLLDDQGAGVDGDGRRPRPRPVRARRARGQLLARVRPARQAGHHRRVPAHPPGRAGGHRHPARPRHPRRRRRARAGAGRQRPHWEPGQFHGYHGQSLGWYESQLLRRVDPERRTIGRYFADEVARPLGIEFYIGLPDDRHRRPTGHVHRRRAGAGCAAPAPDATPARRSACATRAASPAVSSATPRSSPAPRTSTAATCCGSSCRRSTASATPGRSPPPTAPSPPARHQLGLDRRTRDLLEASPTPPAQGSRDRILCVDTAYAFGFMKPFPHPPVRLLDPRLRPHRNRRLVRLRRSRPRPRLRLRDEPRRLLRTDRPTRARPAKRPRGLVRLTMMSP